MTITLSIFLSTETRNVSACKGTQVLKFANAFLPFRFVGVSGIVFVLLYRKSEPRGVIPSKLRLSVTGLPDGLFRYKNSQFWFLLMAVGSENF
jgi:hypothetical protein